MFRFALVFIFLNLVLNVSAQDRPIELRGIIVSSENDLGLESVNISVQGQLSRGTITDTEGRFSIRVDALPVNLIISSIGYETKKYIVKDQEEIFVQLIPNSTELPEIIVSAAPKIDTIYKEPYNVVDFAFKDGYLILLIYKNVFEKYELVLLDEAEEYVAHYNLKDYKPSSLFKSCLGMLYLVTNIGVYNIETNSNSIHLGTWIDDEKYETVIEPCVLSVDSLLFYQKHLYQGQALLYYAFINKKGSKDSLTILPLLEDEVNIRRLIEETGNRIPWSGDFWDENVPDKLNVIREEPYFLKGKLRMYFPKIYAPIFKKDSMICLFNHLSSAIYYFDRKGNEKRAVPIQYHKMKRWKEYVLYDEFTQDVYTAFHTRWGEYICQIDLETGTLSEAIPVNLDFIDNVLIRNGILYFLHRDPYQGGRQRMIQKINITR